MLEVSMFSAVRGPGMYSRPARRLRRMRSPLRQLRTDLTNRRRSSRCSMSGPYGMKTRRPRHGRVAEQLKARAQTSTMTATSQESGAELALAWLLAALRGQDLVVNLLDRGDGARLLVAD